MELEESVGLGEEVGASGHGLGGADVASGDGLRNALRGGVFGDVAGSIRAATIWSTPFRARVSTSSRESWRPFFHLTPSMRRARAKIAPQAFRAGWGRISFLRAAESRDDFRRNGKRNFGRGAGADVQPDGGVYAVQLGVRQARLLPQARAALFAGSRAAQRANVARHNAARRAKTSAGSSSFGS